MWASERTSTRPLSTSSSSSSSSKKNVLLSMFVIPPRVCSLVLFSKPTLFVATACLSAALPLFHSWAELLDLSALLDSGDTLARGKAKTLPEFRWMKRKEHRGVLCVTCRLEFVSINKALGSVPARGAVTSTSGIMLKSRDGRLQMPEPI